eukprot:11604850-Alexandrium_andersonii.AAC.1
MAAATGCRGAAPAAVLAARPMAATPLLWRATSWPMLPLVRLPRARWPASARSSWRTGWPGMAA